MPQPVLKASGGLLLRPWAALDAPALYQASLDPEIQKWNKWRLDGEDEARATISGGREGGRPEAGGARGRVALGRDPLGPPRARRPDGAHRDAARPRRRRGGVLDGPMGARGRG